MPFFTDKCRTANESGVSSISNKVSRIFLYLLEILVFSHCKKSEITEYSSINDYLALKPSTVFLYSYDSIGYNRLYERTDTFHFIIKDSVREEFTDNEGRPGYIIERFIKKGDTAPFEPFKVYYIVITSTYALEVYDNVPVIILMQPVNRQNAWNCNAFNNLSGQKCYSSYLRDTVVNGRSYTDVISISFKNTDNIVEKRILKRLYAKNMGLILLQDDSINTDPQLYPDGYSKKFSQL